MSQTTIASPQVFSPAYNPLKFIIDSTNKNNTGFKYIFSVYESGTSNKIGEYKMLPTYGDGYGEIDLSKLLQSQVTWDLNTLSRYQMQPMIRFIMRLEGFYNFCNHRTRTSSSCCGLTDAIICGSQILAVPS